MSSAQRKLSFAVLAVLAPLLLAACGSSHSRVSTGTYAGESGANAPYLDVGPLVYEVQLSRLLNPYDTEDAAYLQGLPPSLGRLPPGQEWFGVFLQVYNRSSRPRLAASRVTVSDTQGTAYLPVIPGPTNEFAYRGASSRPMAGCRCSIRSPPTAPRRARCCSTGSTSSRSTTAR